MKESIKNNDIKNKFNNILLNLEKVSLSEDNLSEVRVKDEGCEVIVREIFFKIDNKKYLRSNELSKELKYSKVRVNNVLRKLVKEKYLVRKRVGNCYYYRKY